MPRIRPRTWQSPDRGRARPKAITALLLCGAAIGTGTAADLPAGPPPASPSIGLDARTSQSGPSLAAPDLVLPRGFRLGDDPGTGGGPAFRIAPTTGIAATPRIPRFDARPSDDLIGFMEREALRCRRQSPLPAFDVDDEADGGLALERSRQAGTIFTRSVKRAARQQFERILRSSDSLGSLLNRSWDFGGRGGASSSGAGRGPEDPGPPGRSDGRPASGGFTSSLRFRLDAHPRLVLDTQFLGGRGRIELPLRDEAVRLSFERPIGARGRAILSAGLRPGGDDAARLTFSFGF